MSEDWEWKSETDTRPNDKSESSLQEFRRRNRVYEAWYVDDTTAELAIQLPAVVKYTKNGTWVIVPPNIEYRWRKQHVNHQYQTKEVAMVTAKMMYLTGVWNASE